MSKNGLPRRILLLTIKTFTISSQTVNKTTLLFPGCCCVVFFFLTIKKRACFPQGCRVVFYTHGQQNSFCSFLEARKLICYSFWLWILIINYKYNLFPLDLTEQCCCPHNKYFTFDCENRCACFGIIPPWLFQMWKIHFHIRLSKFIFTNPNKNINRFFSTSKLKQTLSSENSKNIKIHHLRNRCALRTTKHPWGSLASTGVDGRPSAV